MPSSGSLAPHDPQNVASCRFLVPHARQALDRKSFAPHELQKRSSSRFMRPHDRQSIVPSPLTSRQCRTTEIATLDGRLAGEESVQT
jgi:hypothetical protein